MLVGRFGKRLDQCSLKVGGDVDGGCKMHYRRSTVGGVLI